MVQSSRHDEHFASVAKARVQAEQRQAERAAEIVGKQAQLKREAQERREQREQNLKPR